MLSKIKKMIGILIEDEIPIAPRHNDQKSALDIPTVSRSPDNEKQLVYNTMVTNSIRDYQDKLLESYEMQRNAREEVRRMQIENDRIAEEKRFFKEKMLLIC